MESKASKASKASKESMENKVILVKMASKARMEWSERLA
jgi:hypothetical protein